MYVVYVVGGLLAYIFFGGITYELIEDRDDKPYSAALWPIVWCCWFIKQVALAGPRVIRAVRQARKDKEKAKSFARAQVVK